MTHSGPCLIICPENILSDSHEEIFDAVDPGLAPPALSRERFRVLWGRYGKDTTSILAKASPEALEPIPGTRTLWAELPHAAVNEKIRHLDDLLLRRVRIGLLLHEGGKAYHGPHQISLCTGDELG